jgi:hypothetical protein
MSLVFQNIDPPPRLASVAERGQYFETRNIRLLSYSNNLSTGISQTLPIGYPYCRKLVEFVLFAVRMVQFDSYDTQITHPPRNGCFNLSKFLGTLPFLRIIFVRGSVYGSKRVRLHISEFSFS